MACETTEGDPSLQNSLELSINQFSEVPKYAFKEVLIIYSGMITCDPGNIFDTISNLKELGVKVSIISLSAAIYICQKLCLETQGEFNVAKDTVHYDELLQRNLMPKISLAAAEERDVLLIKMGFPKKNITPKPVMCSCHKLLKCVVFECPK
jgi:transcription initiation factor TFIIH subunit 2